MKVEKFTAYFAGTPDDFRGQVPRTGLRPSGDRMLKLR